MTAPRCAFAGLAPALLARPPPTVRTSARHARRTMATAAYSSPATRLRELTSGTRRGVAAEPAARDAVLAEVAALEATAWSGPGAGPLASEEGQRLLDGPWELVYQLTNAETFEGGADSVPAAEVRAGRLQRASIYATDGEEGKRGAVWQNIDVERGVLENKAVGKWFVFRVEASFAAAEGSATTVEVLFKKAWFQFGFLPEFSVPISWLGGRGTLDCTYIDENIRLGRGDKGTLFVLLRPDAGKNAQEG